MSGQGSLRAFAFSVLVAGLAGCGSGSNGSGQAAGERLGASEPAAIAEPRPATPGPAAAPVVTGASVAFGTLTIAGAGFGSAKIAPLLWDDFESGAAGAQIASLPKLGSWEPVYPSRSVYTTSQRYSGNQSLLTSHTPTTEFAKFNVGMPEARDFYQAFWFRFRHPQGTRGQLKLAQVHGTYRVGDHNPGVMTGAFAVDADWWASYIALEDTGMYKRFDYPFAPSQDEWHHFEAVLRQSDPGVANGEVTLRVDGRVVYRQAPVTTRERAGQRWELVTFFTGMTNFSVDSETWVDDAYFNDTWARVEICETQTYSNCTRKVLQPLKSWTESTITTALHRGGFAVGDTVYVFVVDANGNSSEQGYSILVQ